MSKGLSKKKKQKSTAVPQKDSSGSSSKSAALPNKSTKNRNGFPWLTLLAGFAAGFLAGGVVLSPECADVCRACESQEQVTDNSPAPRVKPTSSSNQAAAITGPDSTADALALIAKRSLVSDEEWEFPPEPQYSYGGEQYIHLTKGGTYWTPKRIVMKLGEVLDEFGWENTQKKDNLLSQAEMQASADIVWVKKLKQMSSEAFDGTRQLLNRVVNEKAMTTKGSLNGVIKAYSKTKPVGSLPSLADIVPETYRMYIQEECQGFFDMLHRTGGISAEDKRIWILKPTHESNGRGITIYSEASDEEVLRAEFLREDGTCKHDKTKATRENGFVAQRYISSPLLLNGRKSETRAYWVVVSTDPWIVLYRQGMVRLNSEPYVNGDFSNKLVHITNVKQQENHPNFQEVKKGLKWSYRTLGEYLEQSKKVPKRWVFENLVDQLKERLVYTFNATKSLLQPHPGTFAVYGADFIVDSDLHVWLTEIQKYPGMSDGGIKRHIVPALLKETVNIVLEVQRRKQAGESLADLSDFLFDMELLVNEGSNPPYYFINPTALTEEQKAMQATVKFDA